MSPHDQLTGIKEIRVPADETPLKPAMCPERLERVVRIDAHRLENFFISIET